MNKTLKKIDLIFCGIDIAVAITHFMSGDILMGSIFAICVLMFLITGWKE